MEGPWTRDQASASGQVFEDRGLDALIHRLSDGVYSPVQAKGRSSLRPGQVQLLIHAESMADDLVVLIGGEIVDGGLGPTMLVVPTPDFRRLALLTTSRGVPEYSMSFGMKPRSNSRWLPWLVSWDRLVERFGVPPGLTALAIAEERPRLPTSPMGFFGEFEVVRRLAESEHLNLFRPFPDSETASSPSGTLRTATLSDCRSRR